MLDRQITPADQQLLHAALSDGEKSAQAWQAWRANFDFDQNGPRHAPLIPLLQQSLSHLGVDDPLLGKFKGIHRKLWYKNQLKLSQICDILRTWCQNDISAICLPDISLVVHQYADIGMRPIQSHLLVPTSHVNQAIQSLQLQGWLPKHGDLPPNIVETHHFCTLTHPMYGWLQVSWHLFPERLRSRNDKVFWNRKKSIQLLDVSTFVLDPTDQLLYICLQGVYHHQLPLWVADALTLLRHDQSEIDWPRFCAQCEGRPRLAPTLSALTYLSHEFDAPIPSTALTTLRTMSVRQHSVQFAKKWFRRIRTKQHRVRTLIKRNYL